MENSKKLVIKELVKSTKGKTFTVTHKRVKPKKEKDGTISLVSKMNCRTGVKKHLKGGKSTIADNPDLIGVYKMAGNVESGYRCFNVETVESITFQGVVYTFKDS